jgi:hypothetical protein
MLHVLPSRKRTMPVLHDLGGINKLICPILPKFCKFVKSYQNSALKSFQKPIVPLYSV